MFDDRTRDADRPSPLRWVWSQRWLDVLFLHWRTSPAQLRRHIPSPLEVHQYAGAAWMSLVLFRLRVRPRGVPFLPGLSNLLEANLRTYVQFQDRPGIWFLDVLADNRFAIEAARCLTPMPYRSAEVHYTAERNRYGYQIRRKAAILDCEIETTGRQQTVSDDSLDHWLLERYRLYIRGRRGLMYAEVAHPPWSVRPAELLQFSNTIGQDLGLDLSGVPDLAHFSSGVKARFGVFRRLAQQRVQVEV
jgi:uncharacterized protein YqjF (DUF2071 family)